MINGKFGCEIECIVKNSDLYKLHEICNRNNWNYKPDGSIRNYNDRTESGVEFLPTGKYGIKIEKIPELLIELEKAFKLIRVNDTCGLHFHLSFENVTNYYKLCNWKFVNHFQNIIRANFKTKVEKERINKHYCNFYSSEEVCKNDIEDQLRYFDNHSKPSSRYHSINFNAANLYNTIEFRIFAATNKIPKFKKYLTLLMKTVEEYLKQEKFETITFEVEVKPKRKNPSQPILIREIITKAEKLGAQND